jgi:hypothetical protein
MTKMAITQEEPADTTDELIGLLVPPRQSRLRTAFVCLAVLIALASFAALRSFGIVVPRLRAELQSSAVGPRGDVTVVVRLFNDGKIATRIEALGAPQGGLSHPTIITHLPLTITAGDSVGITMHWATHNCAAVAIREAKRFRIRARSGLPLAIGRDYPIRRSYTFVSRLDPPPPPEASGDEFDFVGPGGWVTDTLRIACAYGR